MQMLALPVHTVIALAVLPLLFPATPGFATEAPQPAPKVLTRLFFQDDNTKTLKWADLLSGLTPTLGPVQTVTGFPVLDPERQTLVQMEAAEGFLLVGVRDDDDGHFQSGWVLIESGVGKEEHGDHFHWIYPQTPRVRASVLDDRQGNPAHLYCYDNVFYLANDQLNGFTRLDPAGIRSADTPEQLRQRAIFHPGGGNHITLTAVQNRMAYSSWIDGGGPNKGRVDVTLLSPPGQPQLLGSLHLPHGGIHGATAWRNRVFLAPSDGICWLDVPTEPPVDVKQLKFNHLSLGTVDDRPKRTGAFEVFGQHVGFVSGRGTHAELCLLDAAQAEMELIRLPLQMHKENSPAGLTFLQPRKGSPLAFVFHDHGAEVEAPYQLSVIEVDPNRDDNWRDAQLAKVLDVGRANVQGHYGHHSLTFDADRRRGVFTNPGDGTLVVLNIEDRQPATEFTVGGEPSKILAIGGRGGH